MLKKQLQFQLSKINMSNIKFLQYNCAKLHNVMISILQYAVFNKIDIIIMQKPYYDIQRQMTINHFSFQSIIPKISEIRLKMIIYIAKHNLGLQCTYKTDLINDSDLQILSISNNNIKETYLINVYNEKKQLSNQEIN